MSLDENLTKLNGYMKQFANGPILHHINGKDVPASDGATFETVTPVDMSVLASVAKGTVEDIDAACLAAKEAFKTWSKTSGKDRKAILHRIADKIEERAEELAFLECIDTGQTLRFMKKAALRGADNFRFYADQAPSARDGQSLYGNNQLNITNRVPLGPVAVITPWNTPFMLSTWKIAPALGAGCTVVHKPAEFSPLTARVLVEIAEEAGLPPGVWNMVNGMGEVAGKAVTEHPAIRAVAFVGESRTGSMIQKQAADTLKRVHFELGGKNPCVVFKDADLERAADAAVFMIYSLNGERCTSSSRLLIEREIYDDFIALVEEKARTIKVGHPLDPDATVGPLIHPVHEQKVLSYFDLAKEEGATIAFGGHKVGDEGCYVAPTLFTNANNSMRIAQEEIFGPVLTAMPFDTEAEALEIANDTAYGLTGYIWTQDVTRAIRFSDDLDAGMIWINSENIRHLPSPFAGNTASGVGRDGGDWSFDFYMETKNIAFATTAHRVPVLGAK